MANWGELIMESKREQEAIASAVERFNSNEAPFRVKIKALESVARNAEGSDRAFFQAVIAAVRPPFAILKPSDPLPGWIDEARSELREAESDTARREDAISKYWRATLGLVISLPPLVASLSIIAASCLWSTLKLRAMKIRRGA